MQMSVDAFFRILAILFTTYQIPRSSINITLLYVITHVLDDPYVTRLCPSAIFPLRYCIPSVGLWLRTAL